MTAFHAVRAAFQSLVSEWQTLSLDGLQYTHRSEAWFAIVALLGLSVVVLFARTTIFRTRRAGPVIVPAVLPSMSGSTASGLVHLPQLLFLLGIPFLGLALADPYTALVGQEVTYPGRRICLTIDASNSMSSPFMTDTLRQGGHADEAFFTTVAAAEKFVEMRMKGPHRDLMGLVEFGADAYVVTPFTTDYENILLSLSLIGDPHEFSLFPDQRTLIAAAIQQSVQLFKAFNFLDAAGNLLVIFSDGEDTNAAVNGRPLDDIISGAVQAKVPVYFVRVNYDKALGDARVPDSLWIPAVERTGGKFFAARDERSLLAAIKDIDQVSPGTVKVTEYSTRRPRFAVFAALAFACFTLGAAGKLAVPYFRKFP